MLISVITAIDCLALSTFLYILFAFRDHRRRRGSPYPPGPPSWPIIGNLLDVPKLSPWLTYMNMSKKYGDVISIRVFGQVVVVLRSPTAIKDLLERRGELYADRSPFPIFEPEIMGVEWFFPHARMGNYWREGRKLLDRSLRPGAITPHRRLIEEKTHIFLGQLLATPNAFREHIDLLVPLPRYPITVDSHCSLQGMIVMRLTYGYDLKENDDMLAPPKRVINVMKQFILPGTAAINHLPFLRHLPSWVPWFKYEPLASECREMARRAKNEPMDFVRNSMREGTAVPSLATEYLQEVDFLSDLDSQSRFQGIKDILGSLFLAGSDTTAAFVSSLFLALVLYPEVQKRAQAEIDSVVSRDRLPTYDDKRRLPYIEAVGKELMRWQMVTPLAPHVTTDDDFYRGYFIPKGAMVISNGWGVLHDPELYPDPETFNPDRFLNEDGTFRDDPMLSLAFGAGKRICPGRHFVDTILFIVTASVLSVFNVTRAKDKDGNDIPVAVPPLDSVLPDIAIHLPKFECSITPRDSVAEDLIRASALA
ncbi:cytochrome P450 [Lactarius indigo]|nr:cytochrome P450 [Lactarius indigo]